MTSETPTDPDVLRAEIERTRADLTDTAAALAGKADVKERMKGSAARTSTRLKDRATGMVGQARGRVADRAGTLRDSVRGTDVATVVRRPVPVAVLAAAATAAVVVTLLIRRGRP